MDAVLRAGAVYLFVLLLLRLSGKRNMAQLTAFDFVLLLILAEATQQALLTDDFSLTNSFLVVLTLILLNRVFDYVSYRSKRFDQLVNDTAVLIVDDGEMLEDRMRRLRITPQEVIEQARQSQGVERLDQIKYAVLERTGSISVIPKSG